MNPRINHYIGKLDRMTSWGAVGRLEQQLHPDEIIRDAALLNRLETKMPTAIAITNERVVICAGSSDRTVQAIELDAVTGTAERGYGAYRTQFCVNTEYGPMVGLYGNAAVCNRIMSAIDRETGRYMPPKEAIERDLLGIAELLEAGTITPAEADKLRQKVLGI